MTTRRRIPEIHFHGHRLGRHVKHDERSWAYRVPRTALASVRWSTDATPILDQGSLGSCTGNATVGALLCEPFASSLSAAQVAGLDEALAVELYSRATQTDGFPGTYPPTDTGSDGLDIAKAAQEAGYISGYRHAFGLDDALAALAAGPIIAGIDWLTSMDHPLASGRVTVAGTVRGGHEICFDELDVDGRLVWFRNSWSKGWAAKGRACLTWDDFGRLLANQGDVIAFAPVTAPAPTPDPDAVLASASLDWTAHKKYARNNEALRQALMAWRAAKGL